MAVLSTTGMEPEEVAIREKIRSYAPMLDYAPPEPTDLVPGTISFSFKNPEETQQVELNILASFGFVRAILAKIVVFKVTMKDHNKPSFFVAAQVLFSHYIALVSLLI
jgi:hypothetical protein